MKRSTTISISLQRTCSERWFKLAGKNDLFIHQNERAQIIINGRKVIWLSYSLWSVLCEKRVSCWTGLIEVGSGGLGRCDASQLILRWQFLRCQAGHAKIRPSSADCGPESEPCMLD
eukprot:3976455-Pleurochrysis_carterae.AAC.5